MNLHLAAARRSLLSALALAIFVLGAAPGLASAANRAPTISGKPATSAIVGKPYSFQPTAKDPDGNKLTFSISNKPSWASFSTSTGLLSGTPGYSHGGRQFSNIVITVSDGKSKVSLPAFTITVKPNQPPTIKGNPPTTATVGKTYSFRPTVSDPEGDKLTFTITNKPSWATFNAADGTLSGTPKANHVGTYNNIKIRVGDGRQYVLLPGFSITVKAAQSSPDTPSPTTPSKRAVTLSWKAPTKNEDGTPITGLKGYRVVYGQRASEMNTTLEVPSASMTSVRIESLTAGTWYFAVKAYNSAGIESELSEIVSRTLK